MNVRSINSIYSLIGGLILAYFATDTVRLIIHNKIVYAFLGRDVFTLQILKPVEYQDYPMEDVRQRLLVEQDLDGNKSCLHVVPRKPEYQIISTISTGEKICCSLNAGESSLLVPFVNKGDHTDYLCGYYPDEQLVSIHN